ncbi:helix-turn-helix transcriptional regulator [Pseudomonas veronii]|uniref:Helix-turn-helix transcriptional regulator n=2 Tax=Pseudomonas veronii TaxID=76761 RepID=A0A7Y0ZTD0_PSEVE|nr:MULTISPECIES: winged helix-turn-helix domain-containing protein [Pseudomonas]SEC24338.1 Predicted ATPase [Pseudomonas marginalis]KRP77569.1 transcriptional regulator [Pseudomonas veronii]NMX97690.1 helix-turn-helix transcriptional regulator [Pseudomonas veronii]PUB20246.1 putative ATPase [Pseudomonas sp. GV105]QPO20324.1 helix-turn-helix transcriptional regulator [Pseudomonas sp. Y39-6]
MNDLSEQAVHFGPYRIHPRQRLVLEAGRPLRLGRRAVDILLILLEQAGNVVSKQELIARVWPKSVVEDGNLRVHMAALRKALGDGQAGQRYIVTVAQRGYSFVAPLSIEPMTLPTDGSAQSQAHNLPLRSTRMIGRQALIDALVQQLPQQRFITLTGAGGIGKTTVALRVAELLIGHYRDGIRLLDLAPLSAPSMILPNLAALLDLTPDEHAPLLTLARSLHTRQLLLVIDNCEHLLDDIALISETLLRHAPNVHILATSREALRAEGEYVQRLEPLACPPATGNRAQALGYPALQLLIERAMSHQDSFALSEAELPLAIDICQRLDGIPLAIELVAAQIERFGLQGLLVQMEDNFRLLTRGRRSALPRQQTLRATLDWSFDLLAPCEQICLRRLAVFRGGFSLASAAAVIAGEQIAPAEVLGSITQLVAKSLLNVEPGDDEMVYRLLDITRTYALEKLSVAAELDTTRERHAARCLALMEQARDDWELTATQPWIDRYAPLREDIRAALDWGLGDQGTHLLGIRLTVSAMPLWQELSLLGEHGLYVGKALARLAQSPAPNPHLHMALQLALGSFSYHTQGGTPQTIDAFAYARRLAEANNDLSGQLRAVSGHMAVNLCCGNYRQALAQSLHFDQLGPQADPLLDLSAQRLRVLAQHFAGHQALALQNAEQVIQRMAHSGHLNRFTHGFGVQYDQGVASLTILARILWLRGFPERAWRTANQALELALQINHGTSICYTLALAGVVIARYNGDAAAAHSLQELLLQQAQKHSVQLFHTWARHYAGAAPTQAMPGLGLIADTLVTFNAGALDAAMFERAKSGAAGWCTAEILRVRAEHSDDIPAEALLLEALGLAHQQGALAWELRSATALARLWQRQDRRQAARELLDSVYGRFSEGFATQDLIGVRRLLDELQDKRPA